MSFFSKEFERQENLKIYFAPIDEEDCVVKNIGNTFEEYEENHYYLSDKELFTGRKSGFVISKFMPIGLYALTVLVLVWLLILTNMYTPHVTAYFKMPIIVNLVMGWCVPVLARRFANGEKYIFKRRILQVSKIVAKIQIILLFCNIAAVFVGNYYINIVLPGAMIWVTTLDVAMYANCWKPFFVCILSNVLIVIKDIWTYRFINNHE